MNVQLFIQRIARRIASAVLATLLVACGSSSAQQAARPVTDGPVVELRDNLFHPAQLELAVGTTVTWWWNEGFFGGHNLVGDGFSAPEQISGIFSHRFDTPGTYTYQCTLHEGMTGTIVVSSAGASDTP